MWQVFQSQQTSELSGPQCVCRTRRSVSKLVCEHSSPVAFALINTGALTRREMGGASRRFTGVTEGLVSRIVKRSYMRQQTDTDQLLLSCNCESSDDLFLFVIQPCTHPSSLSESSVHRSRWSVGGHQPLGLLFPPYLEISASFSLFFSSPVLFIAEEARLVKNTVLVFNRHYRPSCLYSFGTLIQLQKSIFPGVSSATSFTHQYFNVI